MPEELLRSGTSAVAIEGRAILIEGAPGVGKSSLALALVDRGAILVGDDAVRLVCDAGGTVFACPPPNIASKLEIRGVGIVDLRSTSAPVALILSIGGDVPRLPDTLDTVELLRSNIPALPFNMDAPNAAIRAEWALKIHGLAAGDSLP